MLTFLFLIKMEAGEVDDYKLRSAHAAKHVWVAVPVITN